jgi:hypothetical protein
MQLKIGGLISDEVTFHISSKVNRNNIRIWGTKQPHAQIEHQRDSSKVNVFCAVSGEKLHGPFLFIAAAVTGDSFLGMLKTGCQTN